MGSHLTDLTVAKDFTKEELQLITDTVARGATPKELQLFLYRCKNMGLDPLKPGQIYFVKYGGMPGTVVVGIDGFRTKAANSGKLSGIKRGAIRNEAGELIGAWAEVYRSDWKEPAREEVSLSEYNTGKAMWAKMPETMIKKVAEAAALRMAFPDSLGGVYAQEEMDQANKSPVVPLSKPEELIGNGVIEGGPYRITYGSYSGRSLEEVGPEELGKYLHKFDERLAKANKRLEELEPHIVEFIERAREFVLSSGEKLANQEEMRKLADEILTKGK